MKAAIILMLFFLIPFAFSSPAVLDTYDGEAETLEGFSIAANSATTIELGRSISSDEATVELDISSPLYGLAITGSFDLQTEDSLVRILLRDASGNEYLVLEAYPLLYGQGYSTFEVICEETCALDGVMASSLKLELYGSSVEIERVHFAADKISPKGAEIDPKETQKELKSSQEAYKVQKLNEQIRQRGLAWTAGETEVSKLSYNEKKRLLGLDEAAPLPSLQGFEYYKGGVFEFQGGAEDLTPKSGAEDNLPDRWDWRDRHNENWISPIEYQGECGSCWAFSALGVTESAINLYYNQHLDFDLSEQEAVCKKGNGCSGSLPSVAFGYLKQGGIVEDSCLPYYGLENACDYTCSDWQSRGWEIDNYESVFPADNEIKRALIEHGPITLGVLFWDGRSLVGDNSMISQVNPLGGHAMVIVGYQKDDFSGETAWIVKNSWGRMWGDEGYGYVILPIVQRLTLFWVEHPYYASDPERYSIDCEDKDHDNYCNWGISKEKPTWCPAECAPEKDCDDSNSHLGPFAENYECQVIELPASVSSINVEDDSKGCCVNPKSRACEPTTASQCCPDSADAYGTVDESGPISSKECRALWFFVSDSPEACAMMNSTVFPNADYCSIGCCCSYNPEYPTEFDAMPSTKAECSGETERWAANDECGRWVCINLMPGLTQPEPTVSRLSRNPTLANIGGKTVQEGELLEIQLLVTGEPPITFAATDIPDGATFDPKAGVFRWTPDQGSPRISTTKFYADNYFGYDSIEVRIDVFGKPVGEDLMWGLVLAIVLAVIAIIACFFGLASLVAGIIGVAGIFGLILGGAIAVLGAGIIGFAIGWLVSSIL